MVVDQKIHVGAKAADLQIPPCFICPISFGPRSSCSVAPFTASTDLDKTRVEIAAGVDVFAVNNLVVRAEVFGSVSDNSDSYGGGVKVALPF